MKISQIVLLTLLIVPVLTGCKPAADAPVDASQYTSGGLSGGLGNQNGGDGKCPSKSAMGIMGLMVKGSADCNPPAKPVCGNKIKEDVEGCDDGNLVSGDGCSSTCTSEKTVAAGVMVIATAQNEDQFSKCSPGKSCTITLKADIKKSGVSGNNYSWTLNSAPDGFKMSSSNNNAANFAIKSTNTPFCDATAAGYDANNCSISVTLCPKGDSDAAHCDKESYVLNSVDTLSIAVTKNDKTSLKCDKTGCIYAPTIEELIGATYDKDPSLEKIAYFVQQDGADRPSKEAMYAWKILNLRLAGESIQDKTVYKWAVSPGTDETFEEWPPCSFLARAFPDANDAVFTLGAVHDAADDKFCHQEDQSASGNGDDASIWWDKRWLMVRPGNEGKTLQLKVTVTGPHGSVTLPLTVTIPNGLSNAIVAKKNGATKKAADDAKTAADAAAAACATFKIDSIDFNGKNLKPTADGKTNLNTPDANHFLIKTDITTLRKNSKIKINMSGGTLPYKTVAMNGDNKVYVTQPQVKVTNGDLWTLFVKTGLEDDLNYNPMDGIIAVPGLLNSIKSTVVDDLNKSGSGFTTSSPQEWQDSIMFAIKDASSSCPAQNVQISRIAVFNTEPRGAKIANVKILADFITEWTDTETQVKFQLFDKDNHLLADTSWWSDAGDDPTCFNTKYSFTPEPGFGDHDISEIDHVVATFSDPDNGTDWAFAYVRLEATGDDGGVKWYAVADSDTSKQTVKNKTDSTTFKVSGGDSSFTPDTDGSMWQPGTPPEHGNEVTKAIVDGDASNCDGGWQTVPLTESAD